MANQARSLAASLIARARNKWGEGAVTITPDGRTAYITTGPGQRIMVPASPREHDLAAVRRAESDLKKVGLGEIPSPGRVSGTQAQASLPDLAVRLKAWREAQHLTQKEVADLIGVPQATLSEWERGTTTPTTAGSKIFLGKLEELMGMERDLINGYSGGRVEAAPVPPAASDPSPDARALAARLPNLKAPPEHRRIGDRGLTMHDVMAWISEVCQENNRLHHEIEQLRAGYQGLSLREIDALRDKARRWDQMQSLIRG